MSGDDHPTTPMTVKILNDFRGQSKSPFKPPNFLAPDGADGFFFLTVPYVSWCCFWKLHFPNLYSEDTHLGSDQLPRMTFIVFHSAERYFKPPPPPRGQIPEESTLLKASFMKSIIICFLNCLTGELSYGIAGLSCGRTWKCFGSTWRESDRARGAQKLDRFHSRFDP